MSLNISPARPNRRHASPRARRALKQRGLDIAQLQGSGPRGRVVEADVLNAATSTKIEIAPEIVVPQSVAEIFSLRADVDASAILNWQTRYEMAPHTLIERALARALSSLGQNEIVCVFSPSPSSRADQWCPALPPETAGILGVGSIKTRAHLCLNADAARWNAEDAAKVFDRIVEILEDPALLAVY